MSLEGEVSMRDHPAWKFALEINKRCRTYFTGPTALWFLEWKQKGRKPDWNPPMFHFGIFGKGENETAAFAFVAAASRNMQEHKELKYVRLFQRDDFRFCFAVAADPMDVLHGFSVSWAQLLMYVDTEEVFESDARKSSVYSMIGSYHPRVGWGEHELDEVKSRWESRGYFINWEQKYPQKSRVSVPIERDTWAEWVSPVPLELK